VYSTLEVDQRRMLRQQLSEQEQEQEQEQHWISNNSEVEENRRGLLTNITSTTATGASSSTALNTGIQSVAGQNQSSNNNYGISYGAVPSLSAPSAEDRQLLRTSTTAHNSIGRSQVATTTNTTTRKNLSMDMFFRHPAWKAIFTQVSVTK